MYVYMYRACSLTAMAIAQSVVGCRVHITERNVGTVATM